MSTLQIPAHDEIRKAVIPAAGLGTRLRPLTHAFPKELLPVGRLPVLAHIANELCSAGITDALFIVSDQKPQIRSFFGDFYAGPTHDGPDRAPLRCEYMVQESQRGLGDALLYSETWAAGEPFVVAFGDCLIDAPNPAEPLRRLIRLHNERGAGATVLAEAVRREEVFRYGVLAPGTAVGDGEPFRIADIVEKPEIDKAPSNLVVAARWVLGPEIFEFLRAAELDARGELSLTEAVRAMIRSGAQCWAAPLRPEEARRDIGNFESFFASFVRAALRDTEFGASVRRVAAEEMAHTPSHSL